MLSFLIFNSDENRLFLCPQYKKYAQLAYNEGQFYTMTHFQIRLRMNAKRKQMFPICKAFNVTGFDVAKFRLIKVYRKSRNLETLALNLRFHKTKLTESN